MGLFNTKKSDESALPPAPNAPPSLNENSKGGDLPPMPAPPEPVAAQVNGNIEEIKSQIAMPEPPTLSESFEEPTSTSFETNKKTKENTEVEQPDSLFDLSDLELPELEEELPEKNQKIEETRKEEDLPSHFIESKKEKIDTDKPFFITTSQFKSVLEIVEAVKSKTKESSQRHLRLLDIKSEEDIEYENLKKDFISIEDKLYELDNLLFDK
jgi:hypothetical protein